MIIVFGYKKDIVDFMKCFGKQINYQHTIDILV